MATLILASVSVLLGFVMGETIINAIVILLMGIH
jgi:hypothetical protein